jgi:signal transduction histidine kinase
MARELIRGGFDAANTVGDVTWAAYSWHNLIGNLLATGDPLAEAQRDAERGLAFARQIRFDLVVYNLAAQLALIRTLRGLTAGFGRFDWEEFDEAQTERRFSSDAGLAFSACWYWVRKLQARFLAGDYTAALDASFNAQRLLWLSERFVEEAEACFYGALSHAASCDAQQPVEYRKHIEALTGYHKQLTVWAQNCPENFENRVALVGAEIARIDGRESDAARLYELAIKSAREHGFVHNEAIAYELAARFYFSRGFEEIGTLYLRKARHGYLRWGADGKVRQIDEMHPGIQEEERTIAATSTITASVEALDLATVVKVLQALTGEIVLEKVLDTLMRIAIEHAGAGRGMLILARPGEHQVVAEVTAEGGAVDVEIRNHPVDMDSLPWSVYHYVLRTHERVILDDAAAQGPFTSDSYIRHRQARSVLCLPLLKQTTLIGVLYLENSLAARAFTPRGIAVLDLLASQAAIALENARLYAELQKAHRLEAMGTLAGGIAHDLNNILGAVLGYGEMAMRDASVGTRLRRDLDAIMLAGERGRALVERVLAFSRSGVVERVAVHVERVVREALDLLGPTIPDGIRLEAQLVAGRAAILGEPTQVHQVLMNLATNAIQAMPFGGTLAVLLEVFNSECERPATVGSLGSGEYIRLTVADGGVGISQEIIDKIFDPFFTTKEPGVGTGLGLSLVHAIVMDLGGAMDVGSTPGAGSTFTVFLPRSGEALEMLESHPPNLPCGNGEHVLVVDDEEALVKLTARTLEELGYLPVSFTSGIAALAAFRDDPSHFDALIADERMPHISGCALVREVRASRRTMPILLMSGYGGTGLTERALEAGADGVLKKPLSAHDLATGLARVLQR